jgi:hypothetical protein
MTLNSSVGIATGYRLDDRGSISGKGVFFFSVASRLGVGPTQPLTQCVPGAFSPEAKFPERETDHSPLSSAEVKNGGALTPHPHTSSWHGA